MHRHYLLGPDGGHASRLVRVVGVATLNIVDFPLRTDRFSQPARRLLRRLFANRSHLRVALMQRPSVDNKHH